MNLPFIIIDGVGAAESSYCKNGVLRASVLQAPVQGWGTGSLYRD